MKLKSLTAIDDRLKKFNQYIDNIDFTKARYGGKNSKDIFFGNYKTENIYLFCDESVDENSLKDILKDIVKKWWKDFESGIEFHTYMGDEYFIEIKQKKDESNVWEFIVESMDDTIYFKFNTNFVVNL